MKHNGVELDQDALNILRLASEKNRLTTTDCRQQLNLKDNDYTRRRIQKLSESGLVSTDKQPMSDGSHLMVTAIEITDEGTEFVSSWNFDGMGEGLPLSEKVDRIERRVETLEKENTNLRRELASQDTVNGLENRIESVEEQLETAFGAIRMLRNYLRHGANVSDLHEYAPDEFRRD